MRRLAVLLLLALTLACSDDSGPFGAGGVSFSGDLQPIFNAECVGCHSDPYAMADLDLSDGASHEELIDVPSTGYAMPRVTPYYPSQSVIYGKMLGDGSFGGVMPQGGALPADQVEMVRLWIVDGAPNN